MSELVGRAYARAGLLGNPSDGYGGRVLAFTFEDFSARVRLRPADGIRVGTTFGSRQVAADLPRLLARAPATSSGAEALMIAAVRRLLRGRDAVTRSDRAPEFAGGFSLDLVSDIPRQVGLAGSSAIVIATQRAVANAFGIDVDPFALAELALATEVEDLGITAGPQDRVVQAYEGFLDMDFAPPRRPEGYRRLNPALLPPLFIGWDRNPGESSGAIHDRVRARYDAGEPAVREALAEFPRLATAGARALEAADVGALMQLVDRNFDVRARIWTISPRDRTMIDLGRGAGAAVKFCGSGGAVLGVLPDEALWPRIARDFREGGFAVMRPRVTGLEESER